MKGRAPQGPRERSASATSPARSPPFGQVEKHADALDQTDAASEATLRRCPPTTLALPPALERPERGEGTGLPALLHPPSVSPQGYLSVGALGARRAAEPRAALSSG